MRKVSRVRAWAIAGVAAAVTAATGVVSTAGAEPTAPTAARADCKGIGTAFNDRMLPGQCLRNGGYRFEMQYDGNLVLYSGGHVCWASGTDGTDGVYANYSGDWQLDSPFLSLESQFGQLRKWRGKYTGLHKTGDISLNAKGEVWIAYGKFVNC